MIILIEFQLFLSILLTILLLFSLGVNLLLMMKRKEEFATTIGEKMMLADLETKRLSNELLRAKILSIHHNLSDRMFKGKN